MKRLLIIPVLALLAGCSQAPMSPFQGYGSIIVSGPVSTQATVFWTPQYSSDPGYTHTVSLPATVSVSYDYGRSVAVTAAWAPENGSVAGPCTVLLYNGQSPVSSGSATIAAGNPVTAILAATWPTH